MHYFTETSAEMFNSLWIWCVRLRESLCCGRAQHLEETMGEFLLLLGGGEGSITGWGGRTGL